LALESRVVLRFAIERHHGVPLWIDPRALSLGRIVGEARRWHARHARGKGKTLGLIAVDYLQLVAVETKSRDRSREEQVARISKTMKMPAKELQLPVMELSWHPKTVASSCVDANGFQ
jgi:replicative DNA helicase